MSTQPQLTNITYRISRRISYYTQQNIFAYCFFFGCETWSLTLREEHRLRVFKNRVLREIFGAERDEVTGEWKKLRDKKIYDLCFLMNITKDGLGM